MSVVILCRTLGFIAMGALIAATALDWRLLRSEPGVGKAIRALLLASTAGIITSFTRAPMVIWPMAFAMVGAMVFLIWAMLKDNLRKRRCCQSKG